MRPVVFVSVVAAISTLGACRARSCARRSEEIPWSDAGKNKKKTAASTDDDSGPKGIDRCRADDKTNVPLPPLPIDLDAGTSDERPSEHAMRDAMDGLCGDVWCESSFEYWFHHYRCDASGDRCVMQMRMYRRSTESVENDAGARETDGEHFKARIVQRNALASCVPPCFRDAPSWTPCEVFDVECDVRPPPGGQPYLLRGQDAVYACTSKTLELVEKRFPELRRPRRK